MKTPDVIYLAESDKVKGEVSSNFASENPFKTHTSIAYIRKEALLEWAEKRREAVAKEVVIQEGVRLGADAAFEELIEKLNEM